MYGGGVKSCGCYKKELLSGPNNPAWNPDLTEEERIANKTNYAHGNVKKRLAWIEAVFKRDKYTCDLCAKVGGNLAAHHLNCRSKYKEQTFDVNNGITLCRWDHDRFHVYMGGTRVPCTKEDYIRYKELVYESGDVDLADKIVTGKF